MPIRTKLVAIFIAFIIIPSVFVLGLFFSNAQDAFKNRLTERLETIAEMKKDRVEAFFNDRKVDLESFQSYDVIKVNLPVIARYSHDNTSPANTAAYKKLDERMKHVQKIYGYGDVMLTDQKGTVVYVSNEADKTRCLGRPLPDPEGRAFEEGRAGIYFSDVFRGHEEGGRLNMLASAPLNGMDGKFIGTLALTIDMKPIFGLVQDTKGLMKTGDTRIGKKFGDKVVYLNPARNHPDEALKRAVLIGGMRAFPMQEASQGREGSGTATDYRGKEVIAAWRYVPSLGWGIVAKIDAAEAFAPVKEIRDFAAMLVVVILITGILAVFLITKTITGPVSALRMGAELIGSGNLNFKVGTDAKDEIGQLSREFDRMASNLKKVTASRDELDREVAERRKAEERVARTNRIYSVLSEINQMIIRVRAREKILEDACRIVVDLGGFRMSWAGMVDDETRMVKPVASWGSVEGYLDGIRVTTGDEPEGSGPTGTAIRTGEHFICTDIENDPRMAPWREKALKRGYRSCAAFPIITGKRAIGAFMVYSEEKGIFDEDEVKLLDELAADISFGLTFIEQEEEKARAEELLRASEERFRLMLRGVKDYAIVMLDPEGNVVDWNEGAERIKGYSPQEIIGKHFALFYTSEDVMNKKPEYELEQANARESYEDEGIRVRKDGSKFFANVVITALKDEAGNLRGFSKLTRDITERKKAEDEVRKMNEELERRVLDRTTQLMAANKELEAFCYSVSHDLRSPLRSIDGFSQALVEDFSGKLGTKGVDCLTRVRAASQRMAQLIDDLLKLSRVTRGEMRHERIDMSALALTVAAELKTSQPGREVEFAIEDGLFARGDSQLMRVVVENLLGNAWKFTSKREHARIEFSETGPEGGQAFYVKDDGAGFDMAYKDKLFGPFQRLHSTTDFSGTGIGLATVQRIVARHGGRVWAEGEVEKGATFYFTMGHAA